MKRIFLGLFLFVLIYTGVIAQDRSFAKPQILSNLELVDEQSGKIELVQPERIETLLKMQIANNRTQNGIPGYRIRIFSQSGQTARKRSDDTRISFMKAFPEMDAHQEYNTPNWQIYVGDFRTKNIALRELKKIEKIYPGAFIVSDMIDISK
jgi:hypothetical protein